MNVLKRFWDAVSHLLSSDIRCKKCGQWAKFKGHDYGWPDIGDYWWLCPNGHVTNPHG